MNSQFVPPQQFSAPPAMLTRMSPVASQPQATPNSGFYPNKFVPLPPENLQSGIPQFAQPPKSNFGPPPQMQVQNGPKFTQPPLKPDVMQQGPPVVNGPPPSFKPPLPNQLNAMSNRLPPGPPSHLAPSTQMAPPSLGQVGLPPTGQMGQVGSPLQNQMGPPPTGPTLSGYMGSSLPGQMAPPSLNQIGSPPPPGPMGPPPTQGSLNHLTSSGPLGPPRPYQPLLPPTSNEIPTLPSQNQQFTPNHLSNQMQGMNLGGRGYGSGSMNGEGGLPHMPPPLGQHQQQNYANGPGVTPGYPPAPSGAGGYPSQAAYQQAQAQQRRLDPDQMPSPIQVMQDDQKTRSGVFVTNQKGLVPPLVTTKFVVQDNGNASPRFMRSTMYNVPITQDLMKQTSVPFGLIISPMARTVDQEYAPPIVNFGEIGPVRCIRCKAYMCPFMQFIDSGRRFQCLFCKAATDVPAEYFQHLDHTGQRMDRFERPELVLGTYEFLATKDYCRNNTIPKPPAIIFIIDVSYNNIKSGLVNLLCAQMKDIIKNLPIDQGMDKSNMQVGFITYNSTVHFYNIKGTLAAPQMMVVGDIHDMFMPLLDGFLSSLEESEVIIDALMEQIPAMFSDTRETETILLPAILAGLEALKASDCSGKLLVFHSSLPIAEAPGKLKNRDDRKLLGTEKEKLILTPQTQAYNQLGQDCVAVGCSVDLFIFNNAYVDLATIGQIAKLTGGEVYKYTYFQADLDGSRLVNDLITNISRPIAFDAIMRVRTSTGVRPTDFYGHFFMSNTTDMELCSIDSDKGVAIEIKHDDKLTEEEGVYIQVALLYTSCSGQRRLRIINLSLKTCSQMADLYRSCDLDSLINFTAKQSVYKLAEHPPKAIKDSIVTKAAQILANYRKNCASPSSAGQLILPECMKLLPLYVGCLLKSDALSGGSDMTIDDRSFVMQAVTIMDVPNSVNYFYPRLIALHEVQPHQEPVEIPAPIRCSIDKMSDQGVYLLENGIHMFIWIGLAVNSEICHELFGVPSPLHIDVDKSKLPALNNPLSKTIHTIIDLIQAERHRFMRLTLVRQREKLEPVFKHFLVEDRGLDNSPSYVDFLCHMHKEIRTILS